MKNTILALSILLTAASSGKSDETKPLLFQKPAVSRTHVAFGFAGDLWIVPREGGEARRLTNGVGLETDPIFSPDGTQVLAASLDGTLQLWDISTGANLARFNEKHSGKALTVVLSQPSSPLFGAEIKVLSGGTDKKVKLWDFSTGKLEREFVGHEDTVTSVAFSPDNTMALSGSCDHTIRLWWLAGKAPEKEIILTLPEGEPSQQNSQGSPSTLP